MTVNTVENRKSYSGNGVTVAFATPYFIANADIYVYVDGVLQVETTDYTLTGAGVAGGGTVTFVVAPPTGTLNVVILVNPALTQLLDLVENDRNPAGPREQAFDKLTLITQRLSDVLSRSITLADYDTIASLVLPLTADRLSKFLAFDASGNIIAAPGAAASYPVTAYIATLLDDIDAATARATLGADATGDLLFRAATAAAARTILGSAATGDALFLTADPGAAHDILRLEATTTHDFASDADYTLTATEETYGRMRFTDTGVVLTVARNAAVSVAQRGRWYSNETLQDLTIKTAAGTGITIKAGRARFLICDGTNVIDPLSSYYTKTEVDALKIPGDLVQSVVSETATSSTTTTVLPADNTTPQSTEGTQILTATITPTNAANTLRVTAIANLASNAAVENVAAVFQDSTASAIAASAATTSALNAVTVVTIVHEFTAGSVAATTLKLRVGPGAAATLTVNGKSGAGLFNGRFYSSLKVEELKV